MHSRSRGEAACLRHPACEGRGGRSLRTKALPWLEKEKSPWRHRARISLELEVPEFLHRKGLRWLTLGLQSASHTMETMTDVHFKAWGTSGRDYSMHFL